MSKRLTCAALLAMAATLASSPAWAQNERLGADALRCAPAGNPRPLLVQYSREAGTMSLDNGNAASSQAAVVDDSGFRTIGATSNGQDAYRMVFDAAANTFAIHSFKPTPEFNADFARQGRTIAGQRALLERYASVSDTPPLILICTRPGKS